jgi:hypothetical protein
MCVDRDSDRGLIGAVVGPKRSKGKGKDDGDDSHREHTKESTEWKRGTTCGENVAIVALTKIDSKENRQRQQRAKRRSIR